MKLEYPTKHALIITLLTLSILIGFYSLKGSLFFVDYSGDIYNQGIKYLKFAVFLIFLVAVVFLFKTISQMLHKKV
tara:strand:+ start:373 stop:600 length:228 start_codon:yes stop_codon:yes gene_type:complete